VCHRIVVDSDADDIAGVVDRIRPRAAHARRLGQVLVLSVAVDNCVEDAGAFRDIADGDTG
jgi:hypothetical protein